MQNKNLEYLIVKYIGGELSEKETKDFKNLLKDEKNKDYFKFYVKLNHQINSKSKFDYLIKFDQFKTKIDSELKFQFKSILKYAAIILIFLSAGYFYLFKDELTEVIPVIVNNNIEIGTDKAILTLKDGTEITLEKGQDYITNNVKSNGEGIVYNAALVTKPEIAYNYLTIPRGGQYYVKLSDGTEVWLNSESKLKYPVNFVKGETRQVELVYGEAYFDVSPSTTHNGTKFKVLAGIQDIEVLGTEFNIKAYKDENFIYTTLVEGKVLVNSVISNNVLSPNQQTIIDVANSEMQLLNVADMYSVTAWKKGIFSFKEMPLNKIMKVLSRWYNTEVIYINKDVENEKFTGVLGREQTIEDILLTIYNTNSVKYEINNKTIIFK